MRRLSLLAATALSLLSACVLITGVGDLEIDSDVGRADATTSTDDASIDGGGPITPGDDAAIDGASVDGGLDACAPGTDISSDPKHCGRCNHDCLGATCEFGRCGVVRVIGGLPKRGGLAIAAGKIFVSMAGSIRRFEMDGTSPVDVVNAVSPGYLASDATHLYFVDFSDDTIKRWPLTGGTAEPIVTGAFASGVAVSATHLYFTHYIQDGGVERVQLAGGNRETVFGFYDAPEDVEYASGEIVVGGDGVNELAAFANDGFGAKRVLSSGGGPCTFVVKDGQVFFGEQQTGRVLRMPVAGGAKEELAADAGVPVGFAATNDAVFWREYRDDGSVWRVAR